jgi:hypothetical protein
MWVVATTLLLCAAPAWGTQLAYEGDVLPEQDGWTSTGNPPDPAIYTPSVAGGVLSIDATATGVATVNYEKGFAVTSNHLVCEWRSRTSNNDGGSDLAIYYLQDSPSFNEIVVSWRATSGFAYMLNHAEPFIYPTNFSLSPDVFHTFQVESDGPTYTLLVDGLVQLQAEIHQI